MMIALTVLRAALSCQIAHERETGLSKRWLSETASKPGLTIGVGIGIGLEESSSNQQLNSFDPNPNVHCASQDRIKQNAPVTAEYISNGEYSKMPEV
jgi:hypothetical protein